jgi:hypothetical protein
MNHNDGIPAAIVDKFGGAFLGILSKIVEHSRKFRQNVVEILENGSRQSSITVVQNVRNHIV